MLATIVLMGVMAAAEAPPAVPGHAAMQPPAPAAPQNVPLMDDLGSYHRGISTKNKLAQRYFDQGIRLLYGFNHDEAERAFREAARLDPGCAFCWWGVAIVLGPNINLPIDPVRNARAVEAVVKAKSLSVKASEIERELILALMSRYTADPNAERAALDKAYATAMGAVHAKFPNDDDVTVLYAEALMDLRPWKFWDQSGKPAEDTLQIVALLEEVLKRNPTHPGANHYYIHATEASPEPGKALASAKRLDTLVPGAGHLVHMPAHVYMRTGNYAAASEANAKAARVDEKYIKKHDVGGVYPMMYLTHNYHFLAVSAGMEGNSKVALDAAKRVTDMSTAMARSEPMLEFFVPSTIYMNVRFDRFDAVLAAQAPPAELLTTTALWHWSRAMAFTAQKRNDDAAKETAAFEAAAAKVPSEWMMNLNTGKSLLDVAAASLAAKTAEMRGDIDGAIASWTKAVAVQDAMAYDEPPAWFYPVRESLGGTLLRAGKPADAEAVFREDLKRNPNNGRSLFGLSQALAQQKKAKEAASVESQFKDAWRRADVVVTPASL